MFEQIVMKLEIQSVLLKEEIQMFPIAMNWIEHDLQIVIIEQIIAMESLQEIILEVRLKLQHKTIKTQIQDKIQGLNPVLREEINQSQMSLEEGKITKKLPEIIRQEKTETRIQEDKYLIQKIIKSAVIEMVLFFIKVNFNIIFKKNAIINQY